MAATVLAIGAALAPLSESGATPIGTFHRGVYEILGRTVPLPPGEFEAMSTVDMTLGANGTKAAVVLLAHVSENKLGSIVVLLATAADGKLGTGTRADTQCSRPDLYYKQVVSNEDFGVQDCFDIIHILPELFRKPIPQNLLYNTMVTTLDKRGIPLPAAMVSAYFAFANRDGYLRVWYHFNPELRGIQSHPTASAEESDWHQAYIARDPKKIDYMGSLQQWAINWRPYLQQSFAGTLKAPPPAALSAGLVEP